MPNPFDSANLLPEDSRTPFGNPTEEPDYSPDYREIVPELDLPQSFLPLIPADPEKKRIKVFASLTLLALMFAFLTAATVQTALTLLIYPILRQVDLHAVGTLPEQYESIVSFYLKDSSIIYAITLISFLAGNLTAFFIGCRLTKLKPREMFRTRDLRFPKMLQYCLIALWIQNITGYVSVLVSAVLERAGFPNETPSFTLNGSMHKLGVIALYTCIVAPITEELLMRGLVLKNFSRVNQRLGIVLSAFLFAVMHENIPQFIYAFPLGILLAYITIKHNSIAPAIGVHITVNTVTLLMQLASENLPAGTLKWVGLVYFIGVILIAGTTSLLLLGITDRLPAPTPHQSMRGWRLVLTNPMLWLFLLLHISVLLFENGLIRLPF